MCIRLWRIATVPLVAIALALGMASSSARADTIQAHLQSVTNNGNGTWTYDYKLVLTANNGLTTAVSGYESGLVILDFAGLTGTPTLSFVAGDNTALSDWNVGTSATGSGGLLNNVSYSAGETTIAGTAPPSSAKGFDSAAETNVVLSYTNATGLAVSGSTRDLIHLSLTSTYGAHSVSTLSLSRDTGPTDSNIPVETYSIDAPVVPVPAAAWAGMALMGFVGVGKLRQSRRSQT